MLRKLKCCASLIKRTTFAGTVHLIRHNKWNNGNKLLTEDYQNRTEQGLFQELYYLK